MKLIADRKGFLGSKHLHVYTFENFFIITYRVVTSAGKNAWEIPSLKTYLTSIMIRKKRHL
jgi:hypothetical protein